MGTFSEIAKKTASALAVRAGTAVAVWLSAQGIPQELVEQVVVVVDQAVVLLSVAAGLLLDLALVALLRGRVKV